MTTAGRRARGRETQRIWADWMRTQGHPYASSTGASAPGTDVENIAGFDIECKARRDWEGGLLGALRQSLKRPGLFHAVVCRPDGYGPQRVAEWPVTITSAEFARLIRLAGFGDPLVEDEVA